MSDIVVFLGPTLPLAQARAALDACYLPPVAQGDVVSVLRERPRAIAIVDGYFQRAPAVWHKEILLALESGVPVLGAASMGALRAAELADFGMQGVGRVYRWYRNGFLEADDEVAVIHAPAALGHAPLSTAMVDTRATLAQAVADGAIAQATAGSLLDACARTPYWLRTPERLIADGRATGLPDDQLDALARRPVVAQKRLDALALLALLAGSGAPLRASRGLRVARTAKAERLIDRDVCLAWDGERRLSAQALADFYRLHGDRLAPGAGSLAAARAGVGPGAVVDALRAEGRFDAITAAALARDRSDGLGPCEGDDETAFAAYCAAAGFAPSSSCKVVAASIGLGDPARLLERLHRFGPLQ